MLKTIKGMYLNGQIKFSGIPQNVPSRTPVIITFLAEEELTDSSSPVINYQDLDDLAGTWTEEDEIDFWHRIYYLRTIDEDLWK